MQWPKHDKLPLIFVSYCILIYFYAGDKSNIVPSSAYIRINDKQSEITIKRNGVSGHAAFPNGTVNAISLLCSAINGNKHVLSLLSASELSFFSFLGK